MIPKVLRALGMTVLWLAGCHPPSNDRSDSAAIVGTWIVRAPDAPFPLHMFVFHSDGTVLQSNPDAGDPQTSDSNAVGAWIRAGDAFRGKIIEITADRATHQFVSRGEISFSLKVDGNAFSGTANAVFYDIDGQQVGARRQTKLDGERVLP